MTRYQYTGSKPYILVVKGQVHRLKPGDYVDVPTEKMKTQKLKTQQLRKLFVEAEA